jgi:hypothetical protein
MIDRVVRTGKRPAPLAGTATAIDGIGAAIS